MSDYPRSQVPDGLGLWQEAGQVRVQPLRLQLNPQKNDGRKRDERKDKMIVCVGASSSMSVLSIYIQVSRNSPPDLSRQGLMEKETNAFKSCVGEQRFYRLLEYSEEKPGDSFWKCMYVHGYSACSVRRKGIRPKRTPFGSTVLWWVVKQVAPSSPSLGCRWPLPSSPSLASSQNHEYRFDISTSVSTGAYLETWNFPTINLANCWWKTAIAMLSRWRHIFSWFSVNSLEKWRASAFEHRPRAPLTFPTGVCEQILATRWRREVDSDL